MSQKKSTGGVIKMLTCADRGEGKGIGNCLEYANIILLRSLMFLMEITLMVVITVREGTSIT